MRKIIYDFGASWGFNIEYFLTRADIVVAVEADPSAVEIIKSKFNSEIEAGRLFVENVVLTDCQHSNLVPFYLSKIGGGHNQFPKPPSNQMHNFELVYLPSASVEKIVLKYGKPYYIKIDIEGSDAQILRALFMADIRPPYISAECHTSEVFAILHCLGKYESFNLVRGEEVLTKYHSFEDCRSDLTKKYLFQKHSSGPFGPDIQGPWMTPDNFFYYLAFDHLGWKDVHASNEIAPDQNMQVSLSDFVWKQIIQDFFPMGLRKLIAKLRRRI